MGRLLIWKLFLEK